MTKFDPLALPVTELDRSREWYVAILGLKVEFEIPARQAVALQVQATLRDQGAVPACTTAEQFRQFVHDEVAKSDRIVSQAGIQPE